MPLLRSSSLVICVAVVRLSTAGSADPTAEEEDSWACAAISFFCAAGEKRREHWSARCSTAVSFCPVPWDKEEEPDLQVHQNMQTKASQVPCKLLLPVCLSPSA